MSAPEKIDLYKLHKDEYVAPKSPKLVKTRKSRYLAVTGRGAPGGDEFVALVGALYAVAYTIKMTRKFAGKGDYVICKLEGRYWADGESGSEAIAPTDDLRWKLFIRTPDVVTGADLRGAVSKLIEKGKDESVREVELMSIPAGRCMQMLHVGPYEKEEETLTAMREAIERETLTASGPHHEIYLSDPRRVPPERLRTILRIPVR